jgi:hypothetical protein
MKARRSLVGALGVLTFLLAPAAARAEGTACGTDTTVTPDGRISLSSFPGTTTFWYAVQTRVGNSYCIEFKNTSGAAPETPGTVAAFADCGTPFDASTRDTSAIDPADPLNTNRLCWTATATTHHFSVDRATGSAISYTFSAADTTLFSPAWSTNGTYNTYYSFFNTTNATIHVTLTLTKTDGSSAGTTNLTVLSGQTAATNTVALATPRNATGTAKATHDGPPGAILVEADIANFTLSPPYVQPVKFAAPRESR